MARFKQKKRRKAAVVEELEDSDEDDMDYANKAKEIMFFQKVNSAQGIRSMTVLEWTLMDSHDSLALNDIHADNLTCPHTRHNKAAKRFCARL